MARPFRLEAVLSHRRYQEDTARRRLAEAARELNDARSALARQKQVRRDYRQTLRWKQSGSGSASEIQMYTRYLGRLDAEIHSQQQVVDTLARTKEAKRRDLLTCAKDRKAIEKLKERHFAEVARLERDREQKILGEVAISRYQRRT